MPWLMKSEPSEFSIDDLKERGTAPWDGVRNYQARNFMRDEMEKGDRVLFYHSGISKPAVVGIAEVASEAYPDPTQFDEDSPYYDEKSDEDDPRWWLVDISYIDHLPEPVTLAEIKDNEKLSDMTLVNRSRLSVMPVEQEHYDEILRMTEKPQDSGQ